MKNRSTIVLLITIFVLGIFIWGQGVWRSNVPSREYQKRKLFAFNSSTLESLSFQYTNQVIECVKENGIWLTGDDKHGLGPADVALMYQLMAQLNSVGKETTITDKQLELRGLNDSEYGFDHPLVQITAKDHLGETKWTIGRKGPLGKMVYMKIDQQKDIFTASNKLLKIIPTEVDQLRDRMIFSLDMAGVQGLDVRGSGGFVQITKKPKGDWEIQQPVIAPADQSMMAQLLEKLQSLRVVDFVANDVADFSIYGLQNEVQQISLTNGDGTSRMLALGDIVPDKPAFIYARRADETFVFTLPKEVLDLTSYKLEQFRNRTVLPLPPEEITSISLKHGNEHLDLVFTDKTKWEITNPVRWEADSKAVYNLLRIWDEAVVFEFDDIGNDEVAEWVYHFGSTSLGKTNVMHVLPAYGNKGGLRIRWDNEKTIYHINIQSISNDSIDPLMFKHKKVWDIKADAIQKLSLDRWDAMSYGVERLQDGTFVADGTNTVQHAVNHLVLANMLDGLEHLRASNYITYDPRDLAGYGLDNPLYSLHLTLSGTNQLGQVLLIGEEVEAGYYAMVQGRDVVFLLPKKIAELFSNHLYLEKNTSVPESE